MRMIHPRRYSWDFLAWTVHTVMSQPQRIAQVIFLDLISIKPSSSQRPSTLPENKLQHR